MEKGERGISTSQHLAMCTAEYTYDSVPGGVRNLEHYANLTCIKFTAFHLKSFVHLVWVSYAKAKSGNNKPHRNCHLEG
jgi:hypothetical protein